MKALALLQHVCDSVNIERPSALTGLTTEQDQVLRFIDEEHENICGMLDWWWLQRTGDLTFLGYASGSDGAVTDQTTYYRFETASTPFHATLTANGKLQVGAAPTDDYAKDVVRVNYVTDTGKAQIISTWSPFRSTLSGKAWRYGQDEYALPSDCDRISWAMLFRSGSTGISTSPVMLTGISTDELENIRSNRDEYITAGTPAYYAVWRQGTTLDKLRYMIVDPFPECTCHVVFGYFKRPTLLYDTGTDQTPEMPEKHQKVLVDAVILRYYSTLGMGAPAGSAAGQDVAARLTETKQDLDFGLASMMRDQRIAQELPSMDPMTQARQAYHALLGRDI